MLQSADGVSDLLFAVGKPPVVEQHGGLEEFPVELPESVLSESHVAEIAACLMNGEERLAKDLATQGSCDCSYFVEGVARFRVNIFRQNGHTAIVMRKLATKIPRSKRWGCRRSSARW
jgi:twitching motility protein PilT